LPVLPGKYKVVVQYGALKDSGMINVLGDPRNKRSPEVLSAQRTLVDRLNKSVEKLTTATDRLRESNETAEKLLQQWTGVSGREADSLRKMTRAIQDSIKGINELVFGKTLSRQGYGRPYSLTALTKLLEARSAITSKPSAPAEQEMMLLSQAEELTTDFINRVNAFYTTNWAAYRQKMEATKVNLFKEYQPIK
jgi:hypothetical protein